MKTKHVLLFTFICSVFLHTLPSCKKEPDYDKPDYTYSLSEADKAFIPYNGDETLIYLIPNNDTLALFQGVGIKSYYDRSREGGEGGQLYDRGTKEYTFKATHDPLVQINLKIQKDYVDRTKVYLNILNYEYEFEANGKARLDSLTIEGKTFYNVYKSTIYAKYSIYYSPENGLIRFELPNGEVGTIPR